MVAEDSPDGAVAKANAARMHHGHMVLFPGSPVGAGLVECGRQLPHDFGVLPGEVNGLARVRGEVVELVDFAVQAAER